MFVGISQRASQEVHRAAGQNRINAPSVTPPKGGGDLRYRSDV